LRGLKPKQDYRYCVIKGSKPSKTNITSASDAIAALYRSLAKEP
jgi:hypothetical protein